MMTIEKKFIDSPIEKYRVMKFLEKELDKAGVANIDIQRTPVVTRISIEVLNPGRVIGRKGKTINTLTETLKTKFGLENPQISVVESRNPSLEPRLVAKKAAKYIEMGKKVRAVLHYLLREVIRAGALGAEIVAAGKIGAKGARAKSLRVVAGYIPKAGEPARLIRVAHLAANTRSGVIGILVRIVPPGTVFPDKKTTQVVLPKVIEAATEVSENKAEAAVPGATPTEEQKQGEQRRQPPHRGGGDRRGGYGHRPGGPRR